MIKFGNLLPVVALMAAIVLPISSCSESDQASNKANEMASNSNAHPNFQGIWDFRTLTPLQRPLELGDKAVFSSDEAEAFRQKAVDTNDTDSATKKDAPAEYDVELSYNSFWMDFGTVMNEDRRTSLIVDPPNGRLPALTPTAKAALKKNALRIPPVRSIFSYGAAAYRAEGPEALGLSERCLVGFNAGPPLTPSGYNNNLRIIQTPNHLVIFTEMVHSARIIPIDGRPHLPEGMNEWSGDSRGHWDGDTLVIKTTNFTDKIPTFQLPLSLDGLGDSGAVGVASNMRLTERLTLAGESRLIYEYTLNDPSTFTQPFTVVIPLRATDDQIFEYACHEGNHAVPGMLRGARQMEKEEASAAL